MATAIGDLGRTLLLALGFRRYTVLGTVTAATTILATGYTLLQRWLAVSWLPAIPLPAFFLIALFAILFVVTLVYAKELQPKLEVFFDRNDQRCFQETFYGNDREDRGVYVSVLPRATGPAPVRRCIGYLANVFTQSPDGAWIPTSFTIRRRLEWGGAGWDPIDIDNKTNQTLNVCFVRERDPRIHLPLDPRQGMLNRDRHLFHLRDDTVYRFDVVVAPENSPSVEVSLSVQLGDGWNDIKVSRI